MFWSTPKELKSFVDQSIFIIFVVLLALAFILYIVDQVRDNLVDIYLEIAGLGKFYDPHFPNTFTMQYVLPVRNQNDVQYNTTIDMHTESFSAHIPIQVDIHLQLLNNTMPKGFVPPETMYLILEGSHNIPYETTGLGKGYYAGYVPLNRLENTNGFIQYNGTKLVQYEMGGSYPVVVSIGKPSIELYDAAKFDSYPHVNIASEEATNALLNEKSLKKTENVNLSLAIAILALSVVAVRPVIRDIIDEHYADISSERYD